MEKFVKNSTEIFRRYLPNNKWHKLYRKLSIQFYAVNFGLKPAFIWDVGPLVSCNIILIIIANLKEIGIISKKIFLMHFEDEYCVIHKDNLSKIDSTYFLFVDVTETLQAPVLLMKNFSLFELYLNIKQRFNEEKDLYNVDISPNACVPSIIGMLSGFPIIYWYNGSINKDNCLGLQPLITYKVLLEDLEIYSFSVPSILKERTMLHIIRWFNMLKTKHSNLVLRDEIVVMSKVVLGKIEYAYTVMNQALSLDPHSLICNRNMDQIKDMLVPRWHFRMLNDSVRNLAYRNAILKQISLGYDNVLDIGTGTGLLSLFATESTPKFVQACDYSQTMVDIAKKVFEVNNVHNIKLFSTCSFDIDTTNFEKASLLVTEILDSGIFGENIINSILHAADNLMLSDWNIVPCAITVHITAIECESIFRKTRLRNTTLSGLLSTKLSAHSKDMQPYDTENLRHINDVKYLTHVEILYELDLKNRSLKEILNEQKSTVLKCIDTGFVDGFAIWMTLKLDDDNVITSDPRIEQGKFCCWDQAIYPVRQKFYIQEGDNLMINSSCADGTVLNIEHDFLFENMNSIPLPSHILEFLNDEIYIEKLNATSMIIKKDNIPSTNILDLSPIPIIGIQFLKENDMISLTIKNCEQDVKSFIQLITNLNDIKTHKLIFSDLDNITCTEKFDIIVFDWLQETGELSDEFTLQAHLMKFLTPGGLTIPHRIDINGLIIESKWLDFISKVSDVNVSNYRIAEFINKYKIKKHINFRIDSFVYIQCSNTINLGIVNSNGKPFVNNVKVPVICSSTVNGVLYWYNIILYDSISYNTKNQHSYIKNAAFILDEIRCNITDNVALNVLQSNGILKIDI